MSFSFISKISLYLSFIFIISCQDTISSLNNNTDIINNNFKLETEEFLDFSLYADYQENVFDSYTYTPSNYNFLDKDQKKLKINNY